ncbi:MAG: 50S ribosomal protein L4 [bacterium]
MLLIICLKRKKKLAFCTALSVKLREKKIFIVEEIKFDYPKTKKFIEILSNLKLKESVFIIIQQKDENIIKSCRNIKNVKLSLLNNINIYDILKYENLLITREVLENLEVWLNNE